MVAARTTGGESPVTDAVDPKKKKKKSTELTKIR